MPVSQISAHTICFHLHWTHDSDGRGQRVRCDYEFTHKIRDILSKLGTFFKTLRYIVTYYIMILNALRGSKKHTSNHRSY